MKTRTIVVPLFVALISSSIVAAEKNPKAANGAVAQQNPKVQEETQKQIEEKRRQITLEALTALAETRHALVALDRMQKDEALQAISSATGKLDTLLAREPRLALAPTDVQANVVALSSDVKTIRDIRSNAERLMVDGQVQASRHLLMDFGSEIDIRVSNLPLGSYPGALKQAARLVGQDDMERAKIVLQNALNTLVITETLIPIPVATAKILLLESEVLAEKQNRNSSENRELTGHLGAVKRQLELAEAFGYGTKSDFENLYTLLRDIESKTANGKGGTGFFDRIKMSVENMLESIRNFDVRHERRK